MYFHTLYSVPVHFKKVSILNRLDRCGLAMMSCTMQLLMDREVVTSTENDLGDNLEVIGR